MERPRMQQSMPEDCSGWHLASMLGPRLERSCFIPTAGWRCASPTTSSAPSIVVAVAGKGEQALRFDPFSMGAHYHIRPGMAPQIPLPLAEGQDPVEATMAFFEKPLRFRGLLALAEAG